MGQKYQKYSELTQMSRSDIIDWLKWNDQNGDFDSLTWKEAENLMRSELEENEVRTSDLAAWTEARWVLKQNRLAELSEKRESSKIAWSLRTKQIDEAIADAAMIKSLYPLVLSYLKPDGEKYSVEIQDSCQSEDEYHKMFRLCGDDVEFCVEEPKVGSR